MAFKLSNLSLWKQHSILTRPEGFIISLHVITISDFIIWLAPQTGKMTQITRCDCLPERVRCPLGLPAVSHKKKFIRKPYNSSFIDLVCSVKMAGYWCRSGFFFLRVCGPRLRLGPQARQKKELGQYPAILTSHLVHNPYVNNEITTV